jgi:acyl-CoA thioester hydrolase
MGKAKVFERAFRVAAKDIDGLGHVNNVVYLRYAQDAAVAHWFAAVPAEHAESIVWVVRRHEIDYLAPAFKDDELLARTWVGKATAATSERVVEIWRPRDNQLVARVRSVWVPLDAETHRPQRVDESLRTYFEDEDSPEAVQS